MMGSLSELGRLIQGRLKMKSDGFRRPCELGELYSKDLNCRRKYNKAGGCMPEFLISLIST